MCNNAITTTTNIQNKPITWNKWHDLMCYAWCDKKLDSGQKVLTVTDLLIVNVNAKVVCAVWHLILESHAELVIAFFNTNIISSTVWQHKPSSNVKLCLPSAVVTVSSVYVLFTLITLLNSEDVSTMRSISISQILVLPDITDVIVLSIS